jgi:ketosteroid isomerase-like protein
MDTNNLQQAISQLEDQRYSAMQRKDVAKLSELLSDDLRYIHSSGDIDTKTSYLDGLEHDVWTYGAITRSDQTIRATPSVALVFSRLQVDLVARGEPKKLDNLALAVWAFENSRWQLVAVQSGVRQPTIKP